jgi:hypothetical protein
LLIRQVAGIWIPFHIYSIGRKSAKSVLFTHALRDLNRQDGLRHYHTTVFGNKPFCGNDKCCFRNRY